VNKKEKQRWLCAIDRCLKQDEYFTDADKCELCLEANGNCDECICFEYSKHLGLLRSPSYLFCCNIAKSEYHSNAKRHSDTANVRMHLRRMKKWLNV